MFSSREVYRWDYNKIFYIDRFSLVVYIPTVNNINLMHNCRVLVFEVSLNNGAEWTTQI